LPKKNWFTRHETDRFLNNHCQECVRAYLSIHDCLSFLHEVMIGNHQTKTIYCFIEYLHKIQNYLCNQCLSPLMLWVWISISARCTTLCDKVCQWLATGQCLFPGPPVSSTDKTDRHDIAEILLTINMHTDLQISSCWEHISTWNMHE
jgi:hypothetical protein